MKNLRQKINEWDIGSSMIYVLILIAISILFVILHHYFPVAFEWNF